jgi:ribosomal protein S18 acetylase RimI-like enzyme
MEIDLVGRLFCTSAPPPGYRLLPWSRELLEAHAEAKFHSFRTEIDAHVFPCLGELSGCLRLMNEIAHKDGFLPGATWLVAYESRGAYEYCGTIQGIRDRSSLGAIQNLGITPEHRNRGLGSLLMQHALIGFQQSGMRRVFLEVTARNSGAVRLYRRLGFIRARTVYKAVEVPAYS